MKARKGLTVVEILIGIAVVAGLIWWYVARESGKKEQARITAREQEERDRRETERLARLEAEKNAREGARLAKEKADQERQEQQRKAAEAALASKREKEQLETKAKQSIDEEFEYSKLPLDRAFWSARYRMLQAKYEDADLGFITEAKSVEKPKGVTKRTNFWYVNLEYPTNRTIFEIEANQGGKFLVHALREGELPKDVDSTSFMKNMYSGKGVLMSGRNAWICGAGADKRTVALRNLVDGFSPAEADLKGFQKLMSDMKLTMAQNIKYRISLKRTDGKSSTQVAVVSSDAVVDSEAIIKALKIDLTKVAKQGAATGTVGGPKLKRFKQTVVMYDGTHIKKDMHGTTYVPRVFQQFGTAENGTKRAQTVEDFRRQWESLRAEAERQERKAQEIARDNQERKNRFQNEQERAREAIEITDSKARGEIDSYLVFIERGRGR